MHRSKQPSKQPQECPTPEQSTPQSFTKPRSFTKPQSHAKQPPQSFRPARLAGALVLLAGVACSDGTQPTGLTPSQTLLEARRGSTTPSPSGVSNVSRTGYVVTTGLTRGSTVYFDRTYIFDSVATAVAGATYIQTANEDKDASSGSTSLLSFSVNQDVTVYVAHDIAVALPTWLRSSWQDAGASLVYFDPSKNKKTLHLYKRDFPAGTVTLGANADAAAGGAMYSVAVVPTGTAPTAPTAPSAPTPAAPTVAITSPASGGTVSGTTTITAGTTAGAGVAGVTFKVDGATVGAEDTTAPYAAAWSTTATTNGSHAIAAVVRDSAGQTATATVQVTVQNATASTRAGYYVAPTGSTSGDGSSARPWTLASVLSGSVKVQPGDTVWMRGGTYKGDFVSYVAGTSSAPIIIRQYPGERATIDGTLLVQGSYVWFWGFEVISTVVNAQDVMAVNINAPGTKAINLVVHDAGGNGFGMWDPAYDSEIYGSIIYNNGRQRLDGVYAHGIYAHSMPGHTARFADNIVFDQFGYGLHMYTEAGSLSGLRIEGNTTFENGRSASTRGFVEILVGGTQPAERVTVQSNMTYKTSTSGTNVQLGYASTTNRDATVRDNYIVGGQPALRMLRWSSATVSGNTFSQASSDQMLWIEGAVSNWAWASNAYWRSPTDATAWYAAPSYYTLADFRTLMRNTTDQSLGTTPNATKVFVRPNEYEKGRANVTVYNWAGLGSVAVDMSGILAVGDAYEVRNVRDFFGTPSVTGTYGGGSITIPITAVPSPVPLGGFVSSPPPSTTQFQTYVVKRVGT